MIKSPRPPTLPHPPRSPARPSPEAVPPPPPTVPPGTVSHKVTLLGIAAAQQVVSHEADNKPQTARAEVKPNATTPPQPSPPGSQEAGNADSDMNGAAGENAEEAADLWTSSELLRSWRLKANRLVLLRAYTPAVFSPFRYA